MKRVSFLAVAVVAALPLVALGQSFNIDHGDGFGTPSDAYGAAAAQPGSWNNVSFTDFAVPLNDLSGAATGVTATVGGPIAPFSFDNPGTAGDDHALMDDLFDVGGAGGAGSVTISGLAAGTYDVYTYAWAPDSAAFITNVTVGGTTLSSGGAWPGVHASGTTHTEHTVAVAGGTDLVINVATSSGFGSLNGVQVVVPEPASLSLLALGGIAVLRRRR
jgi:hypothetical protein